MSPLVIALMIVGAVAVITFFVFLVVGLRSGWQHSNARRMRTAALALGIVCGLIGVVIAFVG